MPYTADEWAQISDIVERVFAEIDRPNENLLTLTIRVRGDGAVEMAKNWAPDLSSEQMQDLIRHAAAQLIFDGEKRYVKGGPTATFLDRTIGDSPTDPSS